MSTLSETTHAPQGDGNPDGSFSSFGVFRNNLHPARGRKHVAREGLVVLLRNNLRLARGRKLIPPAHVVHIFAKHFIPRKGTETPLPRLSGLSLLQGYNLHLVRGRKLKVMLISSRPPRNNPHPARGRKPVERGKHICRISKQHTSPQGDGNHGITIEVQYLTVETTYTPQGDGNCMKSSFSMS